MPVAVAAGTAEITPGCLMFELRDQGTGKSLEVCLAHSACIGIRGRLVVNFLGSWRRKKTAECRHCCAGLLDLQTGSVVVVIIVIRRCAA